MSHGDMSHMEMCLRAGGGGGGRRMHMYTDYEPSKMKLNWNQKPQMCPSVPPLV